MVPPSLSPGVCRVGWDLWWAGWHPTFSSQGVGGRLVCWRKSGSCQELSAPGLEPVAPLCLKE